MLRISRNKVLFFLLFIVFIAKSANLNVSWINTSNSSDYQTIKKVLSDSKGNVFLVGTFRNSLSSGTSTIYSSGYENLFIAKYDLSGKLLWAKRDCTGEGGLNLQSAAIDKSDNIILCGSFYSNQKTFGSVVLSNLNPSGPTKYFVVKYDSNGNVLWAKGNSNTTLYTSAESVYADQSGNVYLAGTFQDNSISFGSFVLNKSTTDHNNVDGFLVKLDTAGNFIWATLFSGSGSEFASNMVTDPSGNVYIAGKFSGSDANFGSYSVSNLFFIGYGDVFLAKCNSNGDFIWARGAKGGRCEPTSLNIDYSGNIYMGGQFMSHELKFDQFTLTNSKSLNYSDWKEFIVKFTPDGSPIWVNQSSDNTVGDLNSSMCVDKNGFIYSTGYFTSETLTLDTIKLTKSVQTGQDMFFCKYSTNGKIIWAQNVGCSYSSGVSIAVDKSGNLFLAGLYGLNDPAIYKPFNYFGLKNSGSFVAKMLGDTSRLSIDQSFCNSDLSTTLTAPTNNYYYTWINSNNKVISNSRVVTINNPMDSAVYTCKFKNIQDSIIIWTYTLLKNNIKADFSFSLSDCATNSVQYTNLSTSNRGSLSYLWDFGDGSTSTETNPLHKFSTNGIHKVSLSVITSPLSCTNSISKNITFSSKPTIKIEGDTTICHGVPVTLKVQGADSYKWSTGSSADLITVASAKKIWALGYSASGCVSDTVFIKVTDNTPIVSITGNSIYCPGLSVTLKAHGANFYKWSNGETTETITVNKPGLVWLIGRSSTCISDTVKFNVIEEPDFSVLVEGNLYICRGGSTTLKVSGAGAYRWSTGDKSNAITINKPGNYSVIGSNKRGCEKEIDFNIIEELLPSADFSVSSESIDSRNKKISCNAVIQNGVEYKWDMGDGTIENGSSINHNYDLSNSSTSYIITLTVANKWGCTNSHSKSIDVKLFIPNIFTPNGDGLNDIFMPDVDLEILDRNGMSIYKGTMGWDGNYHGKKLPDDTYYYLIRYKDINGQIHTQKGFVVLML